MKKAIKKRTQNEERKDLMMKGVIENKSMRL